MSACPGKREGRKGSFRKINNFTKMKEEVRQICLYLEVI